MFTFLIQCPTRGGLLLATIAIGLIFSTPAAASLTSTNPPIAAVGEQNPVTFAQFLLTATDFVITDTGSSDAFTAVASLDLFQYANIANLPAGVSGGQNATLTLVVTSTTPSVNAGGFLVEGGYSGNFSIMRNTPVNGKTNLLSGTFGTAVLSGAPNGTSATFSDSSITDAGFALTSSFISFPNVSQEDFSIALSFGSPTVFKQGPGNFIANAIASGSGISDSNPVPQALPEPSSVFPMGTGLLGLAWFASVTKRNRASERASRR